MSLLELIFLAAGLSMDAFAVSVCSGLAMAKTAKSLVKKSLIIGLYFGSFQAVMPLVGYSAASRFADRIIAYDHWIAFALLCFLGGKMISGSLKKEERPGHSKQSDGVFNEMKEASVKPAQMLPLAVATSIDALAVGVSFAFLQVNILPSVLLIGLTTFILSVAGVKIGNVFGMKFKSKAEFAGGVILILIGLKILLDHMDIIKL